MKLIVVDGVYYVSGTAMDYETGEKVRVRKSTGCKVGEKVEARRRVERIVAQVIEENRRKVGVNKGSPLVFVRDAVREYERKREREGGVGKDGTYLRRFESEFGGRRLDEVEGWEVLRKIEGRRLASSSQRREAVVVRAVMNYAEASGVRCRFRFERLPKEGEARDRWLSFGERDRLLEVCERSDRELWRLMVVLLETGGRLACVRNLRWGDVSADGESVRLYTRKGKGGKRYYSVPLTERVREVIGEGGERSDALLGEWCSPGFERRNDLYGRWARVCDEAGVVEFRPHDCRHTYATMLAQSGEVDLLQLRDLMGHANLNMTMRYAHHIPVKRAGVMRALSGKGLGGVEKGGGRLH